MAVITFPCPICGELIEMTLKYDDGKTLAVNSIAEHKGQSWHFNITSASPDAEESAIKIGIFYAMEKIHEAG